MKTELTIVLENEEAPLTEPSKTWIYMPAIGKVPIVTVDGLGSFTATRKKAKHLNVPTAYVVEVKGSPMMRTITIVGRGVQYQTNFSCAFGATKTWVKLEPKPLSIV